ncbi:unnamed protein product [Symbiodinium necroappetens]|uniref:Uncharacterized protein n=1 Tax=Symbiodinium necroappetens TaxID=1628268 RepID=A0A812ZJ57_9DINO|nr:unnamed protein product [Symbiodinium necroappetens]
MKLLVLCIIKSELPRQNKTSFHPCRSSVPYSSAGTLKRDALKESCRFGCSGASKADVTGDEALRHGQTEAALLPQDLLFDSAAAAVALRRLVIKQQPADAPVHPPAHDMWWHQAIECYRQCGSFTCEQGDAIDAPVAGLRGAGGKFRASKINMGRPPHGCDVLQEPLDMPLPNDTWAVHDTVAIASTSRVVQFSQPGSHKHWIATSTCAVRSSTPLDHMTWLLHEAEQDQFQHQSQSKMTCSPDPVKSQHTKARQPPPIRLLLIHFGLIHRTAESTRPAAKPCGLLCSKYTSLSRFDAEQCASEQVSVRKNHSQLLGEASRINLFPSSEDVSSQTRPFEFDGVWSYSSGCCTIKAGEIRWQSGLQTYIQATSDVARRAWRSRASAAHDG